MGGRRPLFAALLLAAAFAIAGCERRPGAAGEDATPAWPGHVEILDRDAAVPDLADSLAEAVATGHPTGDSDEDGRGDFTLLALSAGSGYGAFGAGLLTGWSEAGTRPEFDVVTGTSTGALAGALVFAGPAYDDVLEEMYTTLSREDILRFRPLGFLSASVGDPGPLEEKIEAIVDEAFLDRIAAEHARGRRFYVATTDLDRSRPVVWDMGAMASVRDGERLERFRAILLASAAIPVMFPPVYVPTRDGGWAMHADGMLFAPVLLSAFMLEAPRRHAGEDLPLHAWFVVNSKLAPSVDRDPVAPNLAGVSLATLSALVRAMKRKGLVEAYALAKAAGATFSLAYIPDDFPVRGGSKAFLKEDMQDLFAYGRSLALSGDPWVSAPPGFPIVGPAD